MVHPKQHISDLSEICYLKGVKYVVISPGSRNAPLIEAFFRRFGDKCINIVDERSAGYFALGLSRRSGTPVVLVCTSGTAVLNYGPALAEAYYQRIPLLAITADRPEELIDQQDNQTIRQKSIFKNIIKAGYNFPLQIVSEKVLYETHRIMLEALETCLSGSKGPVHINVPLTEPLYEKLPSASHKFSGTSKNSSGSQFSLEDEWKEKFEHAARVMIIHGQDFQNSEVSQTLNLLSKREGTVVIAENIANAPGENIIDIPELMLAHCKEGDLVFPDLIIYSGGQIVSKKLKTYIRNLKVVECWRIGKDEFVIDTFQKSNDLIPLPHSEVYNILSSIIPKKGDALFKESWLKSKKEIERKRVKIIRTLPFSDLKAMDCILEALPSSVNLDLGNSSIIRYSQVFQTNRKTSYYSNRGVSGIDGCLSAASGTAYASGELTVAILGDLSFVYDSNALWNRELSTKFRIIVMNNSGGDIFNLIDGPSESHAFGKFYRAHHPVQIQKLAEAFNLGYFCCEDEVQLKYNLQEFFKESDKPLLMEVKTNSEKNKIAFDLIMGKRTFTDYPE